MSKIDWSSKGVIIGLVHFAPLPGSPHYGGASLSDIEARAAKDRDILIEEGFDAISFSNEADRPYLTTAPIETIAIMSRLITRLTNGISMPFGCGVLIDPMATLAVHALWARTLSASASVSHLGCLVGKCGTRALLPAIARTSVPRTLTFF